MARTVPGRFEASLDLAGRFFDFIESQGAMNARLVRIAHGGTQSGQFVSAWEFEDLRAYGAATDALLGSDAGQTFAREINRDDAPTVVISSALYTEIPL